MSKKNDGFTMVEMLVTIAIGGIFVLLAYITISRFLILQNTISKNSEQTAERILLSKILSDGTMEKVRSSPNGVIIFYYHKLRADTIEIDIKKNIIYKNGKRFQFKILDLKSYQLTNRDKIKFRINFNDEYYEWNIKRAIPAVGN